MQKITRNSLLIALAVLAVTAIPLWRLGLSILYAYLTAVNLTTFLFYAHDKRQAVRGATRIPELILHLLALVGGTIAALLGQMVFRHKTRKSSFQAVFIATALLQIALICVYLYYRSRSQ